MAEGQRGTVTCKQGGGLVGGKWRKGRRQGRQQNAEERGPEMGVDRCQCEMLGSKGT